MASTLIVDQLQKTGGSTTALTLPTSNASANEFQQNNGAGALSWASASAGFSGITPNTTTGSSVYTVPAGITKLIVNEINQLNNMQPRQIDKKLTIKKKAYLFYKYLRSKQKIQALSDFVNNQIVYRKVTDLKNYKDWIHYQYGDYLAENFYKIFN